jgi:hypothetical protein
VWLRVGLDDRETTSPGNPTSISDITVGRPIPLPSPQPIIPPPPEPPKAPKASPDPACGFVGVDLLLPLAVLRLFRRRRT